MATYMIPNPLPILTLPINQVLYPSLTLSIQIASGHSIALLQSLLRDASDSPGNKSLLLGIAPLRAQTTDGSKKVTAAANRLFTPPSSDSSDSSSDDDAKGAEAFSVIRVPKVGGEQGATIPRQEDVFEFATAARIIRLERLTTGGFLAVVEGISRIAIQSYTGNTSFLEANIRVLTATSLPSPDLLPSLQTIATTLLSTLSTTASPLPSLLARRLNAVVSALSMSTAPAVVDILIASIPIAAGLTFQDKLDILAAHDPMERTSRAIEILNRVEEGLRLKKRIGDRVDASLSRRQREYLLMQQLKAISDELKELSKDDARNERQVARKKPTPAQAEDEEEDDMAELEKKIKAKGFSPEARKVAFREMKRIKSMPPHGAEFGVIRNYLDTLLSIPWTESTPLPISRDFINAARIKLDEDHFGLEKIKKRLLEWLAVLRLKQETWDDDNSARLLAAAPVSDPTSTSTEVVLRDPSLPTVNELPAPPAEVVLAPKPVDKGPILLLCGPPGTGKTSIAKSLAEAMGRKFYRISLGGVRDEAEIRGHRRTYIGALPGSLAQALKTTGVNNPVILLDEIDKIGMASTQGDPAAALLEVLDPEQNDKFTDHYLGVPLDLSGVLFIATANSLDTISGPLFDRMESIQLSGYVHDEKLVIAKKYLLPKQLKANSLPPGLLSLSDDVLLHLISSYTFEAGVRSLERRLGSLCRAKAVEYSEARDVSEKAGDGRNGDVTKHGYRPEVTKEDLERILGVPNHNSNMLDKEPLIGVAAGLAFMGAGNGGILYIESTTMPGSGQLKLTGSLEKVISESGTLAMAWVKSHAYELGLASSRTEDVFKNIDVHVHLPEGGIKKDGPSAGVAMVCAIVSLMRGIKIHPRLAMTGEITLRGRVTPVGGIKEKVLGAHRAGVNTIILPYSNRKDVVADLPVTCREEVTFVYAQTIWEALEAAFGAQLWEGPEGQQLRFRVKDLVESRL